MTKPSCGDGTETTWRRPVPTLGFVSADLDRTGVMLVRAWLHDGELVARVHSSMSGDDRQSAEVVVGLEQIEMAVEQWLRGFVEMPA